MVVLPQVDDLLLDMGWCAQLEVLRAGLAVDEPLLPLFSVDPLPSIEGVTGDPKIAAGLGDVACVLGVPQNSKLPPNVPLCLCHTTTSSFQSSQIISFKSSKSSIQAFIPSSSTRFIMPALKSSSYILRRSSSGYPVRTTLSNIPITLSTCV